MALEITLLGPRGSLATPLTPHDLEKRIREILTDYAESPGQDVDKFLSGQPVRRLGGYGGNTACVKVESAQSTLIIDSGSGIRKLGEELMKGPCGQGKGEVHILFTHFHWDHIIGLPFFIPIFVPGNKIHVYAVQENLEQVFRHVFQKPYFPVNYDNVGADIIYHKLEPRKRKKFGDIEVTPYELDHPDPCWGFRFGCMGKAFSYSVDTECVRVSRKDLGADLALYQGLDLLIFDAQYTFKEANEKVDWGHSSAPIGLDIAIREGVKRAIFVHHDPAASDEEISRAERQTRSYYDSLLKSARSLGQELNEVDWEFGQEGMVIKL